MYQNRGEKKIYRLILLVLLFIVVYRNYMSPTNRFLRMDKLMSKMKKIEMGDALYDIKNISKYVFEEESNEQYIESRKVILLDNNNKKITNALLSKTKSGYLIRKWGYEVEIEINLPNKLK